MAEVPDATAREASYQDLDFSSGEEYSARDASSSEADAEEWDKLVDPDDLLSPEEREAMYDDLKENGLFAFVKKYLEERETPLPILLLQFGVLVPPDQILTPQQGLRLLQIAAQRVLRQRDRLTRYNTVDDAVRLISQSRNVVILTGAGVSTSCGIPDFRSADGLYAQLREQGFDELDDPQQMFDIDFFTENPTVFFAFARHIFPSNFTPSSSHRFVKLVEEKGKLLRNYTQNIDTLETQAGVRNALQCHGSFATATCLKCKTQFPGSRIQDDILSGRVALCPLCPAPPPAPPKKVAVKWDSDDEDDDEPSEWEDKAIVKPDITFFGEKLSDAFDHSLLADRGQVDLLIVIGTSLKVAPVSEILSHIPHSVPQILINRDPVAHFTLDICLLGDADVIVADLCRRLESLEEEPWDLEAMRAFELAKTGGATTTPPLLEPIEPERVGESHFWLYPGANRDHRVVKLVMAAHEEGEDSEGEGQDSEGDRQDSEERPRSRMRSADGDEEEREGKRARNVH